MPSSNVCWGIEVGAGAIKALKLERDGENLKVSDFAVIPHKKVLSTPDLDQIDAIRVGLGALVSQFDLKNATIAISIPGHSAFARFAKLPPVEPKKIPDIVKFEAVQQIPFPIEEVEWDYQTFANPDSPDVEVGIFAVTRERVMEKLAQWGDVNVTPDIVTLSPISVFNAIAYDMAFSSKTPGTVILDVGTTSTDLIVAEAGRVWVRTFPIGGHQFTEALVEAFKLTYPKAEKLKREAEANKHARHIFQAMRPIFSDLAQEVQRSIGYYQSLHRDANLTRLIVLGSTFALPGLKKFLGQQLQMEVVQPGQFNRLNVDGPRSGEFQAATLNMATAYGLALQGLGLAAIDANLMPVTVIRDAMWKGKVKWFAAAAVLSVLAGGASFTRYFMDQSKITANPKSAEIDRTKSAIKTLKGEWSTVDSSYVADYRAANASLLIESRDIIPWVVDDLGQVMDSAKKMASTLGTPEKPNPGLIFKKFSTQYASAGATFEDFSQDAPIPPPTAPKAGNKGGGGRDGEDGPGGDRQPKAKPKPPPPPPPPTTPAPGGDPNDEGPKLPPSEGPPRIVVTLTVATTMTDPSEFMKNTVQKWLMDHKIRDAAPYTIKHIEMTQVSVDTVAGDPNAPVNPAAAEGPRNRPKETAAKPRGFDPTKPYEYDERDVQSTARPTTAPGSGATDVNAVAPIPKLPPLGEPGSKISTWQVKWEAYIKEKKEEPKKEGGA